MKWCIQKDTFHRWPRKDTWFLWFSVVLFHWLIGRNWISSESMSQIFKYLPPFFFRIRSAIPQVHLKLTVSPSVTLGLLSFCLSLQVLGLQVSTTAACVMPGNWNPELWQCEANSTNQTTSLTPFSWLEAAVVMILHMTRAWNFSFTQIQINFCFWLCSSFPTGYRFTVQLSLRKSCALTFSIGASKS